VSWGDLGGNVDVGYRPPGGPFAPTETIPAKVAGRATNIAFDSLGNAVALATDDAPISAAVRPVGGTVRRCRRNRSALRSRSGTRWTA